MKRGESIRELLAVMEEPEVGEFKLPPDHVFGITVPKGGSACSKCRFLGEDGKSCGNEYYRGWRESLGVDDIAALPASADEFCCDVFAAAEEPGDT